MSTMPPTPQVTLASGIGWPLAQHGHAHEGILGELKLLIFRMRVQPLVVQGDARRPEAGGADATRSHLGGQITHE